MEFLDKRKIRLDKVENELDHFVLDFVKILEKHTKYVIISGYVALLFGRSRATEDVDIFIRKPDPSALNELFKELEESGYYCLNSDSHPDMRDHLEHSLALRFAKKNTIIPNFEVKYARKPMDLESLEHPLVVILPSGRLRVSPMEQQIVYKRRILKSEKDLEDADHLERVFAGRLDKHLMEKYKKILDL